MEEMLNQFIIALLKMFIHPIMLLLYLILLLYAGINFYINYKQYGKFFVSPWERFERKVGLTLKKHLCRYYGEKNIIVLSNILLYNDKDISSQTDHIFICPGGVFAVEDKNHKGWIFGDNHQKKWTNSYRQKGYKNPVKSQFLNPVRQNQGHILFLEGMFPELKGKIQSIVVFPDEADFKKVEADNVYHLCGLKNCIKSLSKEKDIINVDQYRGIILQMMTQDKSKDKQAVKRHIEYAKGKE